MPQPCSRLGRWFFLCFLVAPALFQAGALVFLMLFDCPSLVSGLGVGFSYGFCNAPALFQAGALPASDFKRTEAAQSAARIFQYTYRSPYKQIYVYMYIYICIHIVERVHKHPMPGVSDSSFECFFCACFSPGVDSRFVFVEMLQSMCGLKRCFFIELCDVSTQVWTETCSFQADTSSYA